MILTGYEIGRLVEAGRITIDPFCPHQIQPNSYDFRLGETLLIPTDPLVDVRKPSQMVALRLPSSGYVLSPNTLYLGCSHERMGSRDFVAQIFAKNTVASLGLFIHLAAPLSHLGSVSQWTLELHAVQPLVVYPGMLVGQITFWVPVGEPCRYIGKYANDKGPVASRIHEEFITASDDMCREHDDDPNRPTNPE